jgi:hypothetical protein
MSLLSALTSHLLNHAGLSALISTRLYPEKLPASTSETPNTMPLATYQLNDEPVSTTHDGKLLYRTRVQVDAWGGSYKSAHVVAHQVFTALQGYSGHMGDQTVSVGGIFRQAKRDQGDENVGLFCVSQDFIINWKDI